MGLGIRRPLWESRLGHLSVVGSDWKFPDLENKTTATTLSRL